MANEKRLIDADALRQKWTSERDFMLNRWGGYGALLNSEKGRVDELGACIADVEAAPTVDAVEVVHGRWIIKAKEAKPFEWVAVAECSNCHAETESQRSLYISGFSMDMVEGIVQREAKDMGLGNYCPNCGAKMDGDGNGTAKD